jgi:hypothetical protein
MPCVISRSAATEQALNAARGQVYGPAHEADHEDQPDRGEPQGEHPDDQKEGQLQVHVPTTLSSLRSMADHPTAVDRTHSGVRVISPW